MVSLEENPILAALPASERLQMSNGVRSITLVVNTVLFEPGDRIEAIYFPLDGVVSLVMPMRDGAIVEVAIIGNEGIVGVPIGSHGGLAVRAVSQVAGRSLRMEGRTFLEWSERSHLFQTLIDHYTQALFGQIALTAACNRLHSAEARLSRWLLMSQDRAGSDQFMITQEFLGQMLGARRSTVSDSARILKGSRLIRYARGHVTIIDRAGLEAEACECYWTIRAELDRVVHTYRETPTQPLPGSEAIDT